MGVATSGYYVRNAQSPTREQLVEFLSSLPKMPVNVAACLAQTASEKIAPCYERSER
jgi:hypothetical protein